jgi:hypothetical protein
MPFGSLEAGVLARVVGVPATMVIGAVICALAAAVTLVYVRRRDQAALQFRKGEAPGVTG